MGSTDPGVEEVRDQHHAEWTALWNATRVKVGHPQATSDGIVIIACMVEGAVCEERARREATQATKLNQELALQLIKTFEYIS